MLVILVLFYLIFTTITTNYYYYCIFKLINTNSIRSHGEHLGTIAKIKEEIYLFLFY